MKINCIIDGQKCEIPENIAYFFRKPTILYCSTFKNSTKIHIQPVLFINEPRSCILSFLVENKTSLVINIQKNPRISLTIDKCYRKNPFLNKGILLESDSEITDSLTKIQECLIHLQKKYSTNIISKILGLNVPSNYVMIRTCPRRIFFWKGPFFNRFKCKQKDLQTS